MVVGWEWEYEWVRVKVYSGSGGNEKLQCRSGGSGRLQCGSGGRGSLYWVEWESESVVGVGREWEYGRVGVRVTWGQVGMKTYSAGHVEWESTVGRVGVGGGSVGRVGVRRRS